MTDATISDDDRDVVRILAFAAREFDRVRDLIVDDDEPGVEQIGDAGSEQGKRRGPGGLLGGVVGAAGSVVGVAGQLVVGRVHPAHKNWSSAPVDDRIDWWVKRFGTAAAALAAVPGLGGRFGKLTSIDDVVAASAQVLVVNAVAREMGVTDVGQRVTTAARIALGRTLDPQAVTRALDDPEAQPQDAVPGQAPDEKSGPLARVGRSATLVWRVAGRVRRLHGDLDNRRKGNVIARAIGNFPGVGAVGSFVSERTGISRAARDAETAFGA